MHNINTSAEAPAAPPPLLLLPMSSARSNRPPDKASIC